MEAPDLKRQKWLEQCNTKNVLESLPEKVGGHSWYKFVDPALTDYDLQTVTQIIADEIQHIVGLFAPNEPEQDQQMMMEEANHGLELEVPLSMDRDI